MIDQNNTFRVFFFQVIQIVRLEGAMWNGVRKVTVIILFSHQTFYRLQVSQGLKYLIFTIVRDHGSNLFFVKD